MTYNKHLLQTCKVVWKRGYKREKGLQYCREVLGYVPLEQVYIEHFRKMFENELGKV